MKFKSVVLCSLLAAAASAQAESGFYVLGSIGQSRFDYSNDAPKSVRNYLVDNDLEDLPLGASQDKSDTGYKLQVGYQVNDNFAVEAGYVDLGKASVKGSGSGVWDGDEIDGSYKSETKISGASLNALVMLPLNPSWSLFAKLGIFNFKVRESVSGIININGDSESLHESSSSTKTKPVYGVGVNFNVNKTVSVRAEVERFNQLGDNGSDKANVDLFTVGAAYRF